MSTRARRTTESEGRHPSRTGRKTAREPGRSRAGGDAGLGRGQFVSLAPDVLVGDITGIVAGRKFLHVIDPGGRKVEYEAVRRVESIAGKSVRTVLLTHEHNDHAPNARLFEGAEVLKPSDLAADADREIDGKTFRLLRTPGHCSTGDQSILVDGVLFVGDLLTWMGITPVEDDRELLRSLDRIPAIEFRHAFSAHGGVMTREEALAEAKRMAGNVRRARRLVRGTPSLDDASCRAIYAEVTGRTDFGPANPLHKQWLRLFGVLALKHRKTRGPGR